MLRCSSPIQGGKKIRELEMIMKKVEMSEDLLKMKKAVYVKEMLREQGSI